MFLRHEGPKTVGGDICIKFSLRSRELEFLDRQCRVLEELLEFRVIDLVSGYSGIADEREGSNRRDTG